MEEGYARTEGKDGNRKEISKESRNPGDERVKMEEMKTEKINWVGRKRWMYRRYWELRGENAELGGWRR